MTGSETIAMTRRLLRDTDPAHYRWGNSELTAYARDAMTHIRHILPAAFLKDATIRDPVWTENDELPLEPRLHPAIPYFAAAKALSEDSADEANIRLADIYMKTYLFLTGVKTWAS